MDDAVLGVAIILLILIAIALAIASFVFWIWMIVDCVQRKKLSDSERIAWLIVLILLGILGAIIYYFAGRR